MGNGCTRSVSHVPFPRPHPQRVTTNFLNYRGNYAVVALGFIALGMCVPPCHLLVFCFCGRRVARCLELEETLQAACPYSSSPVRLSRPSHRR